MSKAPKRNTASPTAVREPVQVYLAGADRKLLDRVAKKTGLSRAEVLRRGVRRMASVVLADENPMLSLIDELAATQHAGANIPDDAAERHDAYLSDSNARPRRSRSKKGRRK